MHAAAPEPGRVILGKAAYAESRGRSPSWVSQMIKRGRLGPPALRDDGAIDAVLADRMLLERTDPHRGARKPVRVHPAALQPAPALPLDGPVVEADVLDLTGARSARSRRDQAEAEMAELKAARMRGELIEAATVRELAQLLAGLVRQGLAARAEGLVDQLRDAPDYDAALALLRDADRALCEGLAAAARERAADAA